ncbi:DUF4097 family beta strand repeat-containing protein [Companilactobacillus muriivasis]|uniref:DUF4097 family beta strand repeat-containing protein n=1 Tax=Companilactobacillus muriivasis TaxID=3081444 RepID=UPI0030C78554
MKKMLLSVLAIIILIIVIITGLIGWTTSTNRRLNASDFALTKLTSKEIKLDSNPERIDLSVRTAVVKIQLGKTNTLKLTNVGSNQYHVNQNDSRLGISEHSADTHQIEIGHSPQIILTLTKRNLHALKIDQLNGTLKLNNLTVQDLQLHHHNGTTVVRGLTITGSGELTKDNGQTDFYQLTNSGLNVSIKSGQFKLNGIKKASSGHSYHEFGNHPLTINSGSGQVRISQ